MRPLRDDFPCFCLIDSKPWLYASWAVSCEKLGSEVMSNDVGVNGQSAVTKRSGGESIISRIENRPWDSGPTRFKLAT